MYMETDQEPSIYVIIHDPLSCPVFSLKKNKKDLLFQIRKRSSNYMFYLEKIEAQIFELVLPKTPFTFNKEG